MAVSVRPGLKALAVRAVWMAVFTSPRSRAGGDVWLCSRQRTSSDQSGSQGEYAVV